MLKLVDISDYEITIDMLKEFSNTLHLEILKEEKLEDENILYTVYDKDKDGISFIVADKEGNILKTNDN